MVNRIDILESMLAELQKKISLLEQKRLIAGADIRITELNDTMVLIELAGNGGELEDLSNRLTLAEEQLEYADANHLTAGEGLMLRDNGLQKVIELNPASMDQMMIGGKRYHEPEDFPFRIRLDQTQPEDTEMKRFVLCAGGTSQMPEALIFAGASAPLHMQKEVFETDRDCCAYLRITLSPGASEISAGTPSAVLKHEPSFPSPDREQYIVPLAKIYIYKTGVKIQQMQFGNIYIAGRVI